MRDFELKPAADIGRAPLEQHRSYQREGGLGANLARFVWWSGVKSWLKVAHRIEIHGREHLPEEGSFMLVANHASHLDALVLGSVLPLRMRDRLFPLAAGDVFFETPAVAAFAATVLNALPVWRKNCGAHAIKDLRNRLASTTTVFILFPEGGRSRDGEMKPFKPGVGMMTAETGVPIVPCHLQGTFAAFPSNARLPRPRKITVHVGPPRLFRDAKNRRAGWNEIAETLEADIRQLGGLPARAEKE